MWCFDVVMFLVIWWCRLMILICLFVLVSGLVVGFVLVFGVDLCERISVLRLVWWIMFLGFVCIVVRLIFSVCVCVWMVGEVRVFFFFFWGLRGGERGIGGCWCVLFFCDFFLLRGEGFLDVVIGFVVMGFFVVFFLVLIIISGVLMVMFLLVFFVSLMICLVIGFFILMVVLLVMMLVSGVFFLMMLLILMC